MRNYHSTLVHLNCCPHLDFLYIPPPPVKKKKKSDIITEVLIIMSYSGDEQHDYLYVGVIFKVLKKQLVVRIYYLKFVLYCFY